MKQLNETVQEAKGEVNTGKQQQMINTKTDKKLEGRSKPKNRENQRTSKTSEKDE